MSPELDNELCTKYPKIFKDRHADMRSTAMCWGFECSDGWYHILNTLCRKIQTHIDWRDSSEDPIPQVVAMQVKEKFGGLRFYYSGGDDYIGGLVSMAESWAANTCEQCGERGTQRDGGWIRTLCNEHNKAA